jgi:hypothetical protein
LSAELSPAELAFLVLAEMHDPNRLVTEAGYNLQGRATLALESIAQAHLEAV